MDVTDEGVDGVWMQTIRKIREAWLDRPLRPGKAVGRWRIVRMLGEGSYGIAYLAMDMETGDPVVVKQVRPSRIGDETGLPMQQYEKRVLESLSHPSIPKVLGHAADRNGAFLVLSYAEGDTVEQLLFERKVKFTERQAAALLQKVADIVACLHAAGVIHRDVRIPNVVVCDGDPHLIDFGLARFLGEPDPFGTDGISHYPPVKQLARRIHPASDLYAMGHFWLFLLYSGYEAPEGTPERSWEEELTLSPDVRRMLRRLLELDPPYPDVAAFQADLARFLDTAPPD